MFKREKSQKCQLVKKCHSKERTFKNESNESLTKINRYSFSDIFATHRFCLFVFSGSQYYNMSIIYSWLSFFLALSAPSKDIAEKNAPDTYNP